MSKLEKALIFLALGSSIYQVKAQATFTEDNQDLSLQEISTLQTRQQLDLLSNDPGCNMECLGLCLSYFPVESGVQKCGCSRTLGDINEQPVAREGSSNKFMPKEIESNQQLVQPIMQEYKNKLKAIDIGILNNAVAYSSLLSTPANKSSNSSSSKSNAKNQTKDNASNATGQSSKPNKKPLKPHKQEFCKPNDKKCKYQLSQCVATCSQKCKSEPKDKRQSCIKLCKNQCMASYRVSSDDQMEDDMVENSEDTQVINNILSSNTELSSEQQQQIHERINSHALYLQQQGELCQPNCIAKCGQIILSDQESEKMNLAAAQIVNCFKSDCGCKSQYKFDKQSAEDTEVFYKYQQDMRVEHLLLEKEIQNAIKYYEFKRTDSVDSVSLIQDPSSPGDDDLSYADVHNQILGDIITGNLKRERNAQVERRSFYLTALAISVLTTAFLITMYTFICKQINKCKQTNYQEASSSKQLRIDRYQRMKSSQEKPCVPNNEQKEATHPVKSPNIAGSPDSGTWRNDQRKWREEYTSHQLNTPKPVTQDQASRLKNLTQTLL